MKRQRYFHIFVSLALLLWIGSSGTAWAGRLFSGSINSPAGKYPAALAAGDFDGDGMIDLAVTNVNPDSHVHSRVKVLLGEGDGLFQVPVGYRVGVSPDSVAVGDFNGDRNLDLAVVDTFEPGRNTGTVSVLLGNGDGTFQSRVKYNMGRAPVAVAVGDFNGDGKMDLAVANEAVRGKRGTVSVLLGNGDGTFQAPIRNEASKSPAFLAVNDLNGDGLLDLVVADRCAIDCSSFATTALLGNGDGTFRVAWAVKHLATPGGIALGDFNGDGKLDLVETYGGSQVSIRLGNGDGTFQQSKHFAAGKESGPIVAADFDGDGLLDIAAADYFGSNVSVLLGKGNGNFQAASNYTLGSAAMAIGMVSADVNGDKKPDLVVTDYSNHVVSVLLNTAR